MFSPKSALRLRHVLLLVCALFSLTVCSSGEDAVPQVTLAVTGDHGLAVGDTLALKVTSTGADSAFEWTSSRTDFASVDDSGTVTGVAAGEATIVVRGTASGATASHAIVVTEEAVPTPFVSITGNPYVLVGGTVSLTATTNGGEDGGHAWTSSDEAVASVDETGVVKGLVVGTTTITATGDDTGASDDIVVTVAQEIPNYDAWAASGHADATADAFNHWNEDGEISTSCAKCHSSPGFVDFIGGDGSAAEVVDAPAPIGTVIHCGACHNDAAEALASVTFPSGVVVDNLGAEARCMTCHQGRASSDTVDDAITESGVTDDDELSDDLGFKNIHYYAAGATLNAGRVRGGYQYADKVYDWRFRHVPDRDTCIGCHDPHSLEVRLDACQDCHIGVVTKDDLKDIRMMASLGQDYDGDDNKDEGIYYEMVGLREHLIGAIQAYTVGEGHGAICYSGDNYPYWFKDTNSDGSCDATEAGYDNSWDKWSARLMRATYNYQVSLKDPGAFAHNAKYMIQLLYDAIEDTNGALDEPADISALVRNDRGHFNGAGKAARYWDEQEDVSPSCSRCHGGSDGFRFFLEYGVGTTVVEPDNGLDCATCHDNFGTSYDLVQVDEVTFASEVTLDDPGNKSNICMTCHQGRKGKKQVDDAIAANKLSFVSVHYLPAGAVKKGTLAQMGYEYDDQEYSAEWTSHGQCINCHDAAATNHSFEPQDNPLCAEGCHSESGPISVEMIRESHTFDYDNDDDTDEPLREEVDTIREALLSQIKVAALLTGPAICYYNNNFYIDTNTNGACDEDEQGKSNRYKMWTAALMKATYNYQLSVADPGAWAHNFDYILQLLIDSIDDLGGDSEALGFIRPPASD